MAGVYQRKDKLYKQAKAEGYRSRAAYKLLELNNKLKVLRPGMTVIDLGAAPGGWLQVAARLVGPKGTVIGIDLEPITEFGEGELGTKSCRPQLIVGDMLVPEVQQQLRAMLKQACGVETADVVLSDMSPKLTGVRFGDVARCAELVEMVFQFAIDGGILKPKGSIIAKIFPGPEADQIFMSRKKGFAKMTRENLDSSRNTSTEIYLVGRGYQQEKGSIK